MLDMKRRDFIAYRPRNERIAQDLNITEGEWVAFCKDFNDTMAKFNVPEAERNELFAIVESTKGDIVKG